MSVTVDWSNLASVYYQMITGEYDGLNLTAHKTQQDILDKQILDSISAFTQIPQLESMAKAAKFIVDLGTGGGFPLLPVAAMFPETPCYGVDAREKKLRAVGVIAKKLELNNVKLIHGTFQDLYFDKAGILFLVKAVGRVTDVIEQINTNYETNILFYKGANFFELEIEEMKKLKNNGQLQNVYEVSVNGAEKRYIVHCTLGKKVPRGTKQIKLFSDQL